MRSVRSVFTGVFALLVALWLLGCNSSPDTNSSPKPIQNNVTAGRVRVSDPGIDTGETAVAADADGNIYVAYVEHAEDKTADLFVHEFDPDLKQVRASVQVNPIKGSAKAWAGDQPTITIAPDKSILVGWTMRAGKGTNFVLSVSRDGGQTFSRPTKINDDEAPLSHGMHSLAVDASGAIHAAWLDERNVSGDHANLQEMRSPSGGFRFVKIDHKEAEHEAAPEPNSEVFVASSTDGGKTFSKNQRIADDVCPCCKTSVLATEGQVFVSWRQVLEGDYRHIAVASSGDGGRTFSLGTIVSDDRWQLNACPVSGPAMMANGGELYVAWYTAGDAGQRGYYTAKTTGGLTFGSRLFVGGEGSSGTPIFVKTNTGPLLVMAGKDEQVILAEISDQGGAFNVQTGVAGAVNPAATFANGSLYIAFGKNENKRRSVWIAKH